MAAYGSSEAIGTTASTWTPVPQAENAATTGRAPETPGSLTDTEATELQPTPSTGTLVISTKNPAVVPGDTLTALGAGPASRTERSTLLASWPLEPVVAAERNVRVGYPERMHASVAWSVITNASRVNPAAALERAWSSARESAAAEQTDKPAAVEPVTRGLELVVVLVVGGAEVVVLGRCTP